MEEDIIKESTKVAEQAASYLPGGANAPGAGIQSQGLAVSGTPEGAAQLSRALSQPFTTADTAQAEMPPTLEQELPEEDVSAPNRVATLRKELESAYKKELDRIQQEKKAAETKQAGFTRQQEGVLQQAEREAEPFRDRVETAERQRLKVEENFFANQTLVDELDELLTESNTLARQLREQKVPGLAGLQQSTRMLRNYENVTGRVAVIEAVMAARNNQIGVANNLIDRKLGNIQQDRRDRLDYLNAVFNWYETQRTEEGTKIFNLSQDEKTAIKKQQELLEDDLERAQASSERIKELMTSPESAEFMARAGVSLNDSVEEINRKMSTESQRQQREGFKNDLVREGYEFVAFPTDEDNVIQFSIGGKILSFKEPIGYELRSIPGDGVVELQKDAQGRVIGQRTIIAPKAEEIEQPTSEFRSIRSERITESVDELSNRVSGSIIGRAAALQEMLPGFLQSDEFRNFKSDLDQLKANISFSELQAMREASKTGGALGQVAVQELKLLEATLGSLDMTQSPANLKKNLEKIKESVNKWNVAQGEAPIEPNSADLDYINSLNLE